MSVKTYKIDSLKCINKAKDDSVKIIYTDRKKIVTKSKTISKTLYEEIVPVDGVVTGEVETVDEKEVLVINGDSYDLVIPMRYLTPLYTDSYELSSRRWHTPLSMFVIAMALVLIGAGVFSVFDKDFKEVSIMELLIMLSVGGIIFLKLESMRPSATIAKAKMLKLSSFIFVIIVGLLIVLNIAIKYESVLLGVTGYFCYGLIAFLYTIKAEEANKRVKGV